MANQRNAQAGAGLRPLSARSLMLSLLLGMHPPRLPAAELVRWCALFGVDEGTARTALSRMASRGEVRGADGVYELAGRTLRRQADQDVALLHDDATRPWDGTWTVAVVTAGERTAAARARLRAELDTARFAEQREGVWTRPRNLDAAEDPGPETHAQCRTWHARPGDDARELAGALWDLDGWAARALDATAALERAVDELERSAAAAIPDAFRAGAAALLVVRADPRLPVEQLPARWPGAGLREAYARYQPAFAAATRAWRRGAA
jgi:phenylacetic acid degradation operon negative regulatory protein